MIEKALIIDEPWISKILRGEKIWEMRSTQTSHRGEFGLIRKGSGQVVGIANLIDVSGPYNAQALARTIDNHRVGPDVYKKPDYKWWYAWKLENVRAFKTPIDYQHKNGAVTWIQLNDESVEEIQRQCSASARVLSSDVDKEMFNLFGGDGVIEDYDEIVGQARLKRMPMPKNSSKINGSALDKKDKEEVSIRIVLTQGNINNSHFYIPRKQSLFPGDAWGGKNKLEAGNLLEFVFDGIDFIVETDIDGSKRILRSRGAVKEFFKIHNVSAGDEIIISRLSERKYKIEMM